VASVIESAAASTEDLAAQLRRERNARGHRLAIQRLAAETSGSTTRHEVARVIADGAAPIVDAGWAFVAFMGDDEMVEFVFGPGMPDEVADDWKNAPIETDVPVAALLRGDIPGFAYSNLEEMGDWPILVGEAERADFASHLGTPIGQFDEHGRPAAVLAFGWPDAHEVSIDESLIIQEMAAAAAPAFRRARRTEVDAAVAETLQSWLRPATAAAVDGFDVDSLYAPGHEAMLVGGDWYDTIPLGDARVAFVVGDVVGHDVRAAAEMGQVRHVLASHLLTSRDVAASLAATDAYFSQRVVNTMATALVFVVDRRSEFVEIGAAGHLAPVSVDRSGHCCTLDFGLGPPIGSGLGGYDSVAVSVPFDAAVIGFTDGLVERRGEQLDESLGHFRSDLGEAVGAATPASSAALLGVIHQVLADAASGPAAVDDAAALVVTRSRV
jgi:hypothetical protein